MIDALMVGNTVWLDHTHSARPVRLEEFGLRTSVVRAPGQAPSTVENELLYPTEIEAWEGRRDRFLRAAYGALEQAMEARSIIDKIRHRVANEVPTVTCQPRAA